MSNPLSKTEAIQYIGFGGRRTVMDRRSNRIGFIIFLTALAVGVLPVIPVGEVLAPEHSGMTPLTNQAGLSAHTTASPVADATTIEKLRHLFSH